MKIVLAILVALALTACTPDSRDTTKDYDLPEGLSDCRAYWLKDTNGSSMTVIRCPNSAVTTGQKSGKVMQYNSVQDF